MKSILNLTDNTMKRPIDSTMLKLTDKLIKDDLHVFINHSVNVSRLENENELANDFVNDIANDFVKTSFDKPGGGGAP